ncbi:histidine kinase, partial [bacterium]|nr:histidine kinase [bacterium]
MELQHHQRQDGSGYPYSLSEVDMPPGARILAVADVVEAMSSHRPYRSGHGIESTLE